MLALTSSFLDSLRPTLTSTSLVSSSMRGHCRERFTGLLWKSLIDTANGNNGSPSWLSVHCEPRIVRDVPTILWDENCQSPHLGGITPLTDCLPSVVRLPVQGAGPQPFLLITTSAWECGGPCAHFIDEEVRIETGQRPLPSHV